MRIFTLTESLPERPGGVRPFAIKLHRAFHGDRASRRGGRFRAGPITYGPESKLRHGVAAERIGDELHRLSRRCLPVDARTLTRPVLVTTGAKLVHGFLRVHPFPDINGRTARALFAALVAATGRYSRPLPRDDDRQARAKSTLWRSSPWIGRSTTRTASTTSTMRRSLVGWIITSKSQRKSPTSQRKALVPWSRDSYQKSGLRSRSEERGGAPFRRRRARPQLGRRSARWRRRFALMGQRFRV
ncbi:MAG: Fic family protein [Myxococcales bacterium]|nr:Fic family protein [Myxococcales bacterium]